MSSNTPLTVEDDKMKDIKDQVKSIIETIENPPMNRAVGVYSIDELGR